MRDRHENRLFSAEDITPVKHGIGVLTVGAGRWFQAQRLCMKWVRAEIINGGGQSESAG